MEKFPEPPSVKKLREVGPDLRPLHEGTTLVRVYSRGGEHPSSWDDIRYYGPVSARFDHHPEPPQMHTDFAILYTADHYITALAERFQETRTIHTRRDEPALVVFELDRELALLDLTSNWPTKAGASMKISTGPRPKARRWSRRIYEAYGAIDGLWYGSAMYRFKPNVALYERAEGAVPSAPNADVSLEDPALREDLKRAAAKLNYDLIP